MKKSTKTALLATVLGAALMSFASASAPQFAIAPHNLTGKNISNMMTEGGTAPLSGLSTSKWTMDGVIHTRLWKNTTGSTWHIQKIFTLLYFDNASSKGNVLIRAGRLSDAGVFMYQSISLPEVMGLASTAPYADFAPNTIDIAPGDSLEVAVLAVCYGEVDSDLSVIFYAVYFTD